MKFLDEYRNEGLARKLVEELHRTVTRPWVLMEVCGGQTHSIVKYGLDRLLPPQVELVHGPGCPVCVTSLEMIDKAHAIAQRPGVIFCSFGDMLRVPGSESDLLVLKSRGADVRVVYSPIDCLKIARAHPDRQVVFFAIGFETTAPANAMAVWQARQQGLTNFSVLVSHVLVPPALAAILESPLNRVQGFLGPGHVCTVMGYREYEPIAAQFKVPIVITGFEPIDILQGTLMTLRQLEEGRHEVENQYPRVVQPEGNRGAQELVAKVFEVCDRKWRGVGSIPQSGYRLREEFRRHDAERLFDVQEIATNEPAICMSGLVLRGVKKPHDCPAFGTQCTPEHPLGATMVSAEGACAADRLRAAPGAISPDGRVNSQPSNGDAAALGSSCPVPLRDYPEIVLAHGSGGKLSQRLMQEVVFPHFRNDLLAPLHDGAILPIDGARIAFSTDSYVVSPLFFPGGDIGTLAVHGTVNDLAMCGARPLYLSCAFILEEGLPMEDFRRIVRSMRTAADAAGVQLVTGDTKVVDRGKADKLFINTAGIGLVSPGVNIHPARAAVGDRILISGTIADHGIAIMSVREGLEFETELASDTAPLHGLVEAILRAGHDIHVLRDPTRGGVTSALTEIAQSAQLGLRLEETAIPIREEVKGACEILGLDPLYVANEGKLLAIVPAYAAEPVLAAMRAHPLGRDAAIIGEVVAEHPGFVTMKTRVGGVRIVDMLSGEQLPRIC